MTFLEVNPPVRATSTDLPVSKMDAKPETQQKAVEPSDLSPPDVPFFPNLA